MAWHRLQTVSGRASSMGEQMQLPEVSIMRNQDIILIWYVVPSLLQQGQSRPVWLQNVQNVVSVILSRNISLSGICGTLCPLHNKVIIARLRHVHPTPTLDRSWSREDPRTLHVTHPTIALNTHPHAPLYTTTGSLCQMVFQAAHHSHLGYDKTLLLGGHSCGCTLMMCVLAANVS